jgi:YfiH family protein
MKGQINRMGFVEREGLRYYQFESLLDQPIFHAVLTRQGGFSQSPFNSLNTGGTVGDDPKLVRLNHEKIFHVFGLDYFSRLDVWQVHGTEIVCGESPRAENEPHEKADGILTNKPEITLFMRFADCVPILLWDPVKRVIGLIHAGWQGSSQKITQRAVEKMQKCYQSSPADIFAAIGPSICQNCYEVGQEVFRAFEMQFGRNVENFFVNVSGRMYLDLWQANAHVLQEAGVHKIEIAELCTACHLDDWYSHRAENGITGRFGVVLKIIEN